MDLVGDEVLCFDLYTTLTHTYYINIYWNCFVFTFLCKSFHSHIKSICIQHSWYICFTKLDFFRMKNLKMSKTRNIFAYIINIYNNAKTPRCVYNIDTIRHHLILCTRFLHMYMYLNTNKNDVRSRGSCKVYMGIQVYLHPHLYVLERNEYRWI